MPSMRDMRDMRDTTPPRTTSYTAKTQNTNSRSRLRTEVCSVRNGREYMEDRYSVENKNPRGFYFFAVYDGHGGCEMADMCADRMPSEIVSEMKRSGNDARASLVQAMKSVDRYCYEKIAARHGKNANKRMKDENAMMCGSTVCMGLLERETGNLTVANVGDTRMVLRTPKGVLQITDDHGMDHARDRARILRGGGRITTDFFGGHRVQGVLNMTRALGDWNLRPHVSPVPDVFVYKLGKRDRWACTASDGLWDVFTNDEVAVIIDDLLTAKSAIKSGKNIARVLVDEAIARGSTDNITVIVTLFV